MRWVLFNGSDFWVAPGVWSKDLGDATEIEEEDVVNWISTTKRYDTGGFYPLLCGRQNFIEYEEKWRLGRES